MGMIKGTHSEVAELGKVLDHSTKGQIPIKIQGHHQAVHHHLDHLTGHHTVVQAPIQGKLPMIIHTLSKTKLVEAMVEVGEE